MSSNMAAGASPRLPKTPQEGPMRRPGGPKRRPRGLQEAPTRPPRGSPMRPRICLLYTSDAADDTPC
eukprot:3010468-Pyramimonas_sp.AAC.1